MRIRALAGWAGVWLFVAGCAGHKPGVARNGATTGAGGDSQNRQQLIVTPASGPTGKITHCNPGSRYVILNFTIGSMPPVGQHLDVYRFGLKVGEVRVSGPQMDDDIAADVLQGEARVGDEVRQ
jgi:hypothetical protein